MTREGKRVQIRKHCLKRGIAITEKNGVFHLFGKGVDISVSDLCVLHPDELMPVHGARECGSLSVRR